MPSRLACATLALALAACSGSAPSDPNIPTPDPGDLVVRHYVGMFHAVAHPGMGNVELSVMADSSKTLRFQPDFVTTGGPILEVWLVAAPDANDNQTVLDNESISLGILKATSGGQTYVVPKDTDLSKFRAVTVWCVDALVNFTTAPLMLQP